MWELFRKVSHWEQVDRMERLDDEGVQRNQQCPVCQMNKELEQQQTAVDVLSTVGLL